MKGCAAAYYHRHFAPQQRDFLHLANHANDGGAIDTVSIVAHKGLARQLKKDALVGGHARSSWDGLAELVDYGV